MADLIRHIYAAEITVYYFTHVYSLLFNNLFLNPINTVNTARVATSTTATPAQPACALPWAIRATAR